MSTPEMVTTADPFVRRRLPPWRVQARVTVAVAVGGALGAAARYGVGLAFPAGADGFPWTTLAVNVTGCALMGLLMVAITEVWIGHSLLRPLLGTGVLGGYTTFATFAGEVDHLAATGHPVAAGLYLLTTPLTALTATWLAAAGTRRLLIRRIR